MSIMSPPRLPLNINSATASKNNDVGVLMKAMKATVVTEQSQKLLNIKIPVRIRFRIIFVSFEK